MPGEQYCEPCKRLLCGNVQPSEESAWYIRFTHHSDAHSFKDALELPCSLCAMAWDAKESMLPSQESIPDGIEGRLMVDQDANAMKLDFFFDHYRVQSRLLCFAPWEDMTHYEFPSILSDSTRSISAVDFLLSKYQECRDEHSGCRLQSAPLARYPSRVIYVGELGDDRMYLRDQDLSDRGAYTCLSHCWGQKQPLMLTKETKSLLQDGIPVSALPKTFQDAIFVTRSLRIKFLWIDSLCIFQDDIADWSTEASYMADIYSQAACTIAATAAKDSDGGLFTKRNPLLLGPRRIEATWTSGPDAVGNEVFAYSQAGSYWCDFRDLWTKAIEKAPLNSRAWVCQERHLSTRIMHFSNDQLFWECHAGRACETYPSGLPEWATPEWFNNLSALKQGLYQIRCQEASMPLKGPGVYRTIPASDAGPPSKSQLYFSWAAFRIRYTECALTKEEDRLIAIQGIAKQLGQVLGDQLIAGLWYNRLLEELCWFKRLFLNELPSRKLTEWRAPTWSWASSDARIWLSNTTKFHPVCKNKQIWGKLESVDVKTKESGELEKASLRIRCKPIYALIRENPGNGEEADYTVYGVLTFQNGKVDIQVRRSAMSEFDIYMDDLERKEIRYVHMIVIQRCPHVDNEDKEEDPYELDCVEGLLLVPRPGCNDVFERVGLFTAKGNLTVGHVLEEHEAADSRVITLI